MRLAVAAWLLLAACAVQAASSVHGKVVGVADGDTVTVLSAKNKRYKIRLQGVDAPELRQAFGRQSKKALSDLVFGQPVRVQLQGKDRYGRWLGKVLVAEPRLPRRPLPLDGGCRPCTDHARPGLVVPRLCQRAKRGGCRHLCPCRKTSPRLPPRPVANEKAHPAVGVAAQTLKRPHGR